jgi:hypothetical protein
LKASGTPNEVYKRNHLTRNSKTNKKVTKTNRQMRHIRRRALPVLKVSIIH